MLKKSYYQFMDDDDEDNDDRIKCRHGAYNIFRMYIYNEELILILFAPWKKFPHLMVPAKQGRQYTSHNFKPFTDYKLK